MAKRTGRFARWLWDSDTQEKLEEVQEKLEEVRAKEQAVIAELDHRIDILLSRLGLDDLTAAVIPEDYSYRRLSYVPFVLKCLLDRLERLEVQIDDLAYAARHEREKRGNS